MKRIKEYISKIQDNKKYKNAILILWYLLCTFFFFKMTLNLGYVSESLYQTHRDYYLGVAISYLLLSVILLQRVKLKNIYMYIFIVIYYFIAMYWLKANEMNWGEELQNVYKMRWLCGGVLGVSMIDAIRYKKVALFKDRRAIASIAFCIVTIGACIVSGLGYYTYLLCFPFIFFYLVRIDINDWNRWLYCLTMGYYASFVYTMVKSFTTVTYTGERYYGIYLNHGLFGIMIGGSFVCALWWLIMSIKKKAPKWVKGLLILPVLFSIISLVMNGARVGELAVVVTTVVVLCIWGGKSDKKSIMRRTIALAIFMCIAVIAMITAFYFIKQYDIDNLDQIVKNDILREKIAYWHDRASTMFNEESINGVFEAGSILNAIDRFSSSRLTFFAMYLQQLNSFGHEFLYIEVNGVAFSHPHNTFIYWLFGLGVVVGAVMLLWVLYYMFNSLKLAIKNKDTYMLSFMWVVYFAVASMNETILWPYITGFILLILQYPLLMDMQNQKKSSK